VIPDRASQSGSPIAAGCRNPQLDGLRAFAAVAVAVYHSVLQLDPSQIQRILSRDIWNIPAGYGTVDKVVLSLWNGQTAVAVFFVLSGAVLFSTLQQRKLRPLISSIDFTVKRILRIYPALFVCLIIYTLVVLAMGDRASVSQFWQNALLIDNPIQGESWTLQVEMLAIPLILVSFVSWRAAGAAGIVAVYVCTWLLFRIPWLAPLFGHPRTYTLCFVLGFLIPTSAGSRIAARFPSGAWPLLLIVLLGARHLIPTRIHSINTDLFSLGLLFVSAGLLVAILYYENAGSLGAFLQRPFAVYLGRASYSFYLYNVIFIRILSVVLLRYTSAREHPVEWGIALSIAVIALTIPVAHLSERFIENPGVMLGRRITRNWGGREPATRAA